MMTYHPLTSHKFFGLTAQNNGTNHNYEYMAIVATLLSGGEASKRLIVAWTFVGGHVIAISIPIYIDTYIYIRACS